MKILPNRNYSMICAFLTDAMEVFWTATTNNNGFVLVNATTHTEYLQYMISDTSNNRNHLLKGKLGVNWRNSYNLQQTTHLMDPNATANFAFPSHGGTRTRFHCFLAEHGQHQCFGLPNNDFFTVLPYTILIDTSRTDFWVLPPEQIKHINPVHPSTHRIQTTPINQIETTDMYVTQLMKVNKPTDEQETYWVQHPKNQGIQIFFSRINQRIYNELLHLKQRTASPKRQWRL